MDNNSSLQDPIAQPKKKRKIFRIMYNVTIHLLAIFAVGLIFVALAVKFKWTNTKGNIDINNRYFSKMASQYGKDLKSKKQNIDNEENLLLQQIGLLAQYKPVDALKISAAYHQSKDLFIAQRMFNATALLLKDNKAFNGALKKLKAKKDRTSLYEFSNYAVWKTFCDAVRKDKAAIDSAARIAGVESRMIVMCLVGEQVRMFNANRERFKQYVYPFNSVILPRNRGYGVTSILEHTALRIERQLVDKNSKFYPGDYFYKCLNTTDAAPGLVVDSIKAHQHKTIQRLIKGGDHFYSYLYTAFLIRQYQAHWQREGYDLSYRPEIVGTLFNLGFEKSKPSKNPKVGGSSFKVGDKEYTFGGLCFEFYYSGEMMKDFPITTTPFTPVEVLEKQNKAHVKKVQDALHLSDSLSTAPTEPVL
ncbi:MAG: hypothetical protein RI948_92 [Bacteroidota bacterium]|jgi:hypothetical protein